MCAAGAEMWKMGRGIGLQKRAGGDTRQIDGMDTVVSGGQQPKFIIFCGIFETIGDTFYTVGTPCMPVEADGKPAMCVEGKQNRLKVRDILGVGIGVSVCILVEKDKGFRRI